MSIGRMSDNGAAPQLYGPDCLQTESESEGGACGRQAQWAWYRCCHGNCRNAALGVGSSCVDDDVTVDDLAGYFDQMLHLPRPMSFRGVASIWLYGLEPPLCLPKWGWAQLGPVPSLDS